MERENERPAGSFRLFIKVFREWRKLRDLFASALDVDIKRKVGLYTQLSTSATLCDFVYWLQILFSSGIATLGLVLNSSAVIIGAMLISPLMAPILSQGLALATGDLILGIRSVVNLALSSLLGVGFAVFLVALLPYKNMTPEILARTEPNTLDLVIALFSGAIGSVATCRKVKGIATSIPGVAIAVALMPPLCVVGYGVGFAISVDLTKGWETAKGGGLLYLTNLVAITFTAMLVFVLLHIDRRRVREAVREWRMGDPESVWWLSQIDRIPALGKAREVRSFSLRLLMILLPLLVIFFPLSQSFSKLRTKFTLQQVKNKINKDAWNIWKEHYEVDTEGKIRSYIDELRIDEKERKLLVFLRVFSNVPYTQGERKQYINLLANKLKRKPETISLQLIQIPTSERDKIKPVIETAPTPLTLAERQESYLRAIDDALLGLKLTTPAKLIDYSITTTSNNRTSLNINYLSRREIDDDGKASLRDRVQERLNLPGLLPKFKRISSEAEKIDFESDEIELTESSVGKLNLAARDLQSHPNLNVKVRLKPDDDDTKIVEERKQALKIFFVRTHAMSENRLVFDETDDDVLMDTYQIFLK